MRWPLVVLLCLAAAWPTSSLAVAGGVTKASLQGLFNGQPEPVLACPVDKSALRTEVTQLAGVRREAKVSTLSGSRYPVVQLTANSMYADLVPGTSQAPNLIEELSDAWSSRVQTGLFRSPLTAFLYERGWRQAFANAGFPGIEAEFAEVSTFFESAESGVVVDMSCGSGLMTRRLVNSGAYGRVLALDYSEAMLRETNRRLSEEGISTATLSLCRADVAALPLQEGSVDAMHAGAALHCWPRLEEGLQQIYAAIKPGGKFFATTFLQGAYGVPMAQQTGGGSFRFFDDEAELEGLFVDAGFERENVSVRIEGRGCAIIKAVR